MYVYYMFVRSPIISLVNRCDRELCEREKKKHVNKQRSF